MTSLISRLNESKNADKRAFPEFFTSFARMSQALKLRVRRHPFCLPSCSILEHVCYDIEAKLTRRAQEA
jgi:hypothetical protein